MTPKEQARYLFDKFFNEQTEIVWTDDEEILKNAENNYLKNKDEQDIYWKKLAIHSALIAAQQIYCWCHDTENLYWQEVEQEILKLL